MKSPVNPLKTAITNFNKAPSPAKLYSIQKTYDSNAKFCIGCDRAIFHNNIVLRLSKKDSKISYYGSTYNTYKEIDGRKYYLKFCRLCMLLKFPKLKNKKRIFNTFSDHNKILFGIDSDIFDKKKLDLGVTEYKMIQKYGKNLGLKRWESYKIKQANSNSFEYKKKKYGWDIKEFNKFNKSRAVTLKNMITKYGEEEGLYRFEKYRERQSYTTSLEYFIEEYGEFVGRKKYAKWQKAKCCGYSKISQVLFSDLETIYPTLTFFYATSTGEKSVVIKKSKNYMLDCYIEELNIAIEFNGDQFHANPKIYGAEDTPHPYYPTMTAKSIWEADHIRNTNLLNRGIEVIEVWEADYKKNPKHTLYSVMSKIDEIERNKARNSRK